VSATNSIGLDRDPRSIIGTRVFDAPRELVWQQWTDPKYLAQWWGPDGFTTSTSAFEFRAGGIWRFVMHGPDGRDYQNRITFDEIVKPERIVYRHDGGEDVEPVQFAQTVTFEDLGSNQTRMIWHGKFPTAEERKRVIETYGADKGPVQTMARLADYLAAMAKSENA
jgi:uncharacterized protein YndB with AHSA1/START domain